MYTPIDLSIYLSIHPSIHPPIHPSIYLCVQYTYNIYIYLYTHTHVCVCVSVCVENMRKCNAIINGTCFNIFKCSPSLSLSTSMAAK